LPTPCHWCPQGDTFLTLEYQVAADVLAAAWQAALRQDGWSVTRQGDIVNATRGTARVSLVGRGQPSGTTVLRLTYSPP
jgi:hypothetical protein